MIAGIFRRTELMVGKAAMDALESAKVIVFGVGGVGSWCAESLVRTGIGEIAIVDSDRVCVTNVNRQLMATIKTAGDVKVDALKNRLHEINPLAKIDAIQKIYCRDTASEFDLRKYDYVIDAIDSLEHKALLIRNALAVETLTLYSSMGAALKMDPFKIRKSEFWKIQ
ncbi:MAG: ThiF family adenylyltransferase, partial [Kiritimatiellae bacterium]|nr:ThiF family adenylyltransferase [Kiritimatiellia bacterium]